MEKLYQVHQEFTGSERITTTHFYLYRQAAQFYSMLYKKGMELPADKTGRLSFISLTKATTSGEEILSAHYFHRWTEKQLSKRTFNIYKGVK